LSRYLLDTNIVSNPLKPSPSQLLLSWLANQTDEDLFISSLNLAEIWSGILELPAGKRRRALEGWFAGSAGPVEFFRNRVLSFNLEAALIWGKLMSEGKRTGRPRDPIDMIVAAIAEANNCVLVTDNEKHFAGIRFINPLKP
jgi:toxin FitB